MADNNNKIEAGFVDIPNGNGTQRIWYKDVEARAAIEQLDPASIDEEPTEGSTNAVSSGGVYTALEGKEDTISDLATIRSGASAGATAYQKPSNGIPKSDLAQAVQDTLSDADTLQTYVPTQASAQNQLADKEFVNSSISTATATYRGAFNSVSDLELTTAATHSDIATALATEVTTADNNDYVFVQIPTADATPTEIAKVERYKYNGTAWSFEYELNNSGFTAAQWAALNSNITSALVTKLSALPTNAELNTLLGQKADKSELPTFATTTTCQDIIDELT